MTLISAALQILCASAMLCASGCRRHSPPALGANPQPDATPVAATPVTADAATPRPTTVYKVSGPTVADIEIGRNAISIPEVSLMLRGGEPQKVLISEVRRRHIPTRLTAFDEQEFLANSASVDLIAALKDEQNILTADQVAIYEQSAADRKSRVQQSVRVAQERLPKQPEAKRTGTVTVARDSSRERKLEEKYDPLVGLVRQGYTNDGGGHWRKPRN